MMDMKNDNPFYDKIKIISEQIGRMGSLTKKLTKITRYESMDYLGERIVDINKSTDERSEQEQIPFSFQETEIEHASKTPVDNLNDQDTNPKRRPIKDILFVDDEDRIRMLFKEALEKFGYNVRVASDGVEGMKCLHENPADLIITDLFMPKKDGHTFINEIMHEFPEPNIFQSPTADTAQMFRQNHS